MAEQEQRISLQDKSDQTGDNNNNNDDEDVYAGLTVAEDPPKDRPADALLGKYGNRMGETIEAGLAPVGKPVGTGLATVARPVGGLVDGVVGGLMRSGAAFGAAAGVGAGNMDHQRAAEEDERHRPVGGQDQTADNPLGLS